MTAKSLLPLTRAADAYRSNRLALGHIGIRLGLTLALSAALALGSEHPASTFCRLLEGFCAGLAAISVTVDGSALSVWSPADKL